MHTQTLSVWQHRHHFAIDTNQGEKRTKFVIALTFAMMILEIGAGYISGSMALLADGWHMATHVAALSITVSAYTYARSHADDPRYSFGTGKMGALGGFASAVALAVVALMMGLESVERIFAQGAIQLDQALAVGVIGLVVNLASALILQGHGHDGHVHELHHAHDHHEHETGHTHAEQDHNLKAAYLHVLADALTSMLAIMALLAGKLLGWLWLDTAMGFVGAAVITWWSYSLVRDTSKVLLDYGADPKLMSEMRQAIESDADNRVTDLHVWRVGPAHWAAQIAIVTHYPQPVSHYKALLARFELAHVGLEVNLAPGEPRVAARLG